jgi:glycolate oxidase iron-sulfur subunit
MKKDAPLQMIERVRSQVEKCISCGNCLYMCPIFLESRDEKHVARGRNQLIKELSYDGEAFLRQAVDYFDKCLLCGKCGSVCPQGIRHDQIVLAARGELVKNFGLPFTKSIAFRQLMLNKERMKQALRVAHKMQWMFPITKIPGNRTQDIIIDELPKIRHIPLSLAGIARGRNLPSIARKFLTDSIPETNPPLRRVEGRNIRVAYFSGCATEYVTPHVGESLVRLLNLLGVEVIFPKKLGCCGIAVYANGDVQTAREMALQNLELLSETGADLVVTACATCGSALKEGWAQLFNGEERESNFRELALKVRDISELLIELSDFKPLMYRSLLPPGTRVTYHDPCHLAGQQGVTEQPRKILQQVFKDRFIEMDYKGCCGCGGSFSLNNYTLSKQIGDAKIESIAKTKADVVINSCPGCMIQLMDGIQRHKLPQQVVHLVEAIEPIETA